MTKFFLFLLFLILGVCDEVYNKVINNLDPEARCSDGSPGIFYLHKGGDLSKFLIYFVGGGSCGEPTLSQTLQSCYNRSFTMFGSSTLWPQTIEGQGILSTDETKSQFANWTKVIFAYCDGSLHQGYSNNVISYRGKDLYFRGAAIVRSHFKWMQQQFNLVNADEVVLTGSSAGGIASFIWSNYLGTLLNKFSALSTIPDSGIFLNQPSSTGQFYFQASMRNLYSLSNRDQSTPNLICNLIWGQNAWKCLFIQYSYTTISNRMLLINSQYDAWVIPNLLLIKCLTKGTSGQTLSNCSSDQLKAIQVYRSKYMQFINQFILFASNNLWTISCSQHVYLIYDNFYNVEQQKVPQKIGQTIRQTIQNFILKKQRKISIDSDNWPKNNPCAY